MTEIKLIIGSAERECNMPSYNDLERNIVNKTISHVAKTASSYNPLMRPGISTHPIPFFGRLSNARVVTLGLNPSSKEFTRDRNWPETITPEKLCERLVCYFDSADILPHKFFDAWSEALAHINSSYKNDAVHLDLSPRATRAAGSFKTNPNLSLFLDMLRADAHIWVDAIEAMENIELILAAGSASKEHYINEFIKLELCEVINIHLEGNWKRGKGPGQTAFHTLIMPSGKQIPMFFCSTGPAAPNGGPILVNAVRENASKINIIRNTFLRTHNV